MSIANLSWALRKPVKPASCKLVLIILGDCCPDGGYAYPCTETICDRTSLDRKTVISCLDTLEKKGLIKDTGKRVGNTRQIKVYSLESEDSAKPPEIPGKTPDSPSKAPEIPSKASQKRDTERTRNVNGTTINDTVLLKEAEEVYEIYPRKVGKPKALASIAKILKLRKFEYIKERTTAFATAWKGGDLTYCPMPATWFNQERFNDSPEEWTRTKREPSRETIRKEGGPTPSGPQDF